MNGPFDTASALTGGLSSCMRCTCWARTIANCSTPNCHNCMGSGRCSFSRRRREPSSAWSAWLTCAARSTEAWQSRQHLARRTASGDVIESTAAELRAHGYRDESLKLSGPSHRLVPQPAS